MNERIEEHPVYQRAVHAGMTRKEAERLAYPAALRKAQEREREREAAFEEVERAAARAQAETARLRELLVSLGTTETYIEWWLSRSNASSPADEAKQ